MRGISRFNLAPCPSIRFRDHLEFSGQQRVIDPHDDVPWPIKVFFLCCQISITTRFHFLYFYCLFPSAATWKYTIFTLSLHYLFRIYLKKKS